MALLDDGQDHLPIEMTGKENILIVYSIEKQAVLSHRSKPGIVATA